MPQVGVVLCEFGAVRRLCSSSSRRRVRREWLRRRSLLDLRGGRGDPGGKLVGALAQRRGCVALP
eukprot:5870706-Pleurochrysis_carterae.AAC.1